MTTSRIRTATGARAYARHLWLICLLAASGTLPGCGSTSIGVIGSAISLSPTSASLTVGEKLHLTVSAKPAASSCEWTSSDKAVLSPAGDGFFEAKAAGVSQAVAQCGSIRARAAVVVKSQSTTPIVITQGGTYSGTWISDDPASPAVRVETTQPVTIRDSTIASRGDLISIPVTGTGANVTIQNVTGTGLDPEVAGIQRGTFVTAEGIASLTVRDCSITGVRFGVKVLSSDATKLVVTRNIASNLEDRESDGQGGLLPDRPDLGHFLMLNGVALPKGADISWNQVTNTIGQSSTEDVFNIYKSQGSPSFPIAVHDNYMEGNSSPASPDNYTGSGLITDGDSSGIETAFVSFARNEVVHTAGSGVEIAAGNHITVSDNRVVSCGVDASGDWYAAPFVNAVVVWNYYAEPSFSNITVQGTVGGMLRPGPNNGAMIADIWVRAGDLDDTDTIQAKSFSDPCLKNGALNLGAEDDERAFWQAKLASAGVVVGNPNLAQ